MGKPSGFLDYQRNELHHRKIKERLGDWGEIVTDCHEYKDILKQQAARCMECSIPFCHSGMMMNGSVSGCPLHNLMPEFNDFVYSSQEEAAYARLNLTNNFPEFTSRVCPAPCEGACTAGLVAAPVTIKNIEQYIIDYAFARDWVQPRTPCVRSGSKVAVIGSGPAGLACADELNKAGHTVTVFERDDRPGGLLMYGIPNMKLSKQLVQRRINLMQKAGILFRLNSAITTRKDAEKLLAEYDAVVLCTGSTVPRDLTLPGRDLKGVLFAKDYLQKATVCLLQGQEAAADYSAAGKDVIIIGGGDTGTDCLATALRQKCRSVHQIEIMPRLPDERTDNNPWPEFPRIFRTDYGQEESICVYGADPRLYCTQTEELLGTDGSISEVKITSIEWEKENGRLVPRSVAGTAKIMPAQLVILALGFIGTKKPLFEAFGIEATVQNNIAAGEENYATSHVGVFAAGDARRGQSLVVWAIAEGRRAAAAVDQYLLSNNRKQAI